MGSCSKRHLLLTVCVLQLLSTVQRQVFDFLGYMWTPILLNFFNIIFVIFGFFGGYQYRPKYIITYTVWNLLWLAWNIFVICFYLSVGVLDKESSILNLGTGSVSWWEANGPGCKAVYSLDEIDPARQYRATSITDCVIRYEYVEIAQAAWQSLLACLGFISGVCLSRIFIEEDDSFDFLSGDGKSPRHLALQPMYVSYTSLTQSSKPHSNTSSKHQSLYSIELSPQREVRTIDDSLDYDTTVQASSQVSPKPMTPRRVKRRSVMTRGTTGRQSSSRSHHRSSVRSSRRKAQNPVTRLIEQQSNTSSFSNFEKPGLNPNAGFNPHNQLPHPNIIPHPNPLCHDPNPIYYNTSNTNLIQPQQMHMVQAHSNPMYQQSSNQSLNHDQEFEELYNNRPASVRSSYSNFHGTRPVSYNGDNYFSQNNFVPSQATPQVPQKRTNPNRQSVRSSAFLNNGPPAYNFQGHTPPDSETTM